MSAAKWWSNVSADEASQPAWRVEISRVTAACAVGRRGGCVRVGRERDMVLRLGSGKCRKEREAFDSASDAFGRKELDFWELYLDELP
jgi:hypothetical protein